ncbi:hypothetical protein F8S09_15495 [Deinococcus sp. SDU3-2]|uniref:Uncharacterized protein n=1 Tax=Deinococcus terrestris TaxID=2651870 RepID=A0A7X1NYE9_9DEIO|nr:hypothetical protein [Deinococcus terrestris]MPY68060.1 hypothetical protein [Deinococcus terrestris]
MSDAVRVYTTAAFAPLASEIKRFGALLWDEALSLFGEELVTHALRRKVCTVRDTPVGKVLYLLHQGRRLVGVTGSFTPTDAALMDDVCLRQAALKLEEAGFDLDLRSRKQSVIYTDGDRKVLVLARHAGYSFAALRRLYHALIETGEYSEIHLYSYLDPEALGKLARTLYEPVTSKPLDPQRLQLHRLDPPGMEAAATQITD